MVMLLEVTAHMLEDTLIHRLVFKLVESAPHIIDIRSCTFHLQGSSMCTSTHGTKLIKIQIVGEEA